MSCCSECSVDRSWGTKELVSRSYRPLGAWLKGYSEKEATGESCGGMEQLRSDIATEPSGTEGESIEEGRALVGRVVRPESVGLTVWVDSRRKMPPSIRVGDRGSAEWAASSVVERPRDRVSGHLAGDGFRQEGTGYIWDVRGGLSTEAFRSSSLTRQYDVWRGSAGEATKGAPKPRPLGLVEPARFRITRGGFGRYEVGTGEEDESLGS